MDNPKAPLDGKVAVITGAARNIGRATTKRLASYGVSVVVNAVQDREAADAVAHEIFEAGGKAHCQVLGLRIQFAVTHHPVNQAPTFRRGDIEPITQQRDFHGSLHTSRTRQ